VAILGTERIAVKKREGFNAFLGKDAEFDGKLSFTGAVRIDGHFRGEIVEGDTLIVGESALIESTIHVSHLIVSGEIRGEIVADHRIELHAPGRVFGNIHAPTVVIDEGAVFEGSCKMQNTRAPEDKKLSVIR
jgi:cytoskeletal protein CcmA (bactofilin family)